MKRYAALLRAVNVGGTGKLPMADLKRMCVEVGFEDVRTYIASGNVVLSSGLAASGVKAALEDRLETYAGKPVDVFVRTAAEMGRVLEGNPFSGCEGRLTYVVFLPGSPPKDALEQITGVNGEEVRLGRKELYVHYPLGMGTSKLKIPAAGQGTARNMNTVAKLVQMLS
jgi:uncharacterized protein (DUF1697 family)